MTSADEYVHMVRRFRPVDVLEAIGRFNNVHYPLDQLAESDPRREFALAGVAATALTHGTPHRSPRKLADSDLAELCGAFIEVEDPLGPEDPLLPFLLRMAYQQSGFLLPEMAEFARPMVLLQGDGWPAAQDWEDLLGIPLVDFWRVTFALHVGTMKHLLTTDELASSDLWRSVRGTRSQVDFEDLIRRFFSVGLEDLRATGGGSPSFVKHAFNPLRESPLVELWPGKWMAPSPRWVLDRATMTGLYFIGRGGWGSRFSNSLGHRFQRYVGEQLGLLDAAEVQPEIVYRTSVGERRSCDFLLRSGRSLLLVEVKISRPIEAARLGLAQGVEDSVSKINEAMDQLRETRLELQRAERRQEFDVVGEFDRLAGLVVTLEPFELVGSPLFEHDDAGIPVAICSAAELERLVSHLATAEDPVSVIVDRATSGAALLAPDLDVPRNPILDDAWGLLSEWTGELLEGQGL